MGELLECRLRASNWFLIICSRKEASFMDTKSTFESTVTCDILESMCVDMDVFFANSKESDCDDAF